MKLVFPLAVRGAFVRRSLLEFGGAQKRDIDQGVKQRKAAFEAVGVARGAGDAPEPSSPPSRGGVADEFAALENRKFQAGLRQPGAEVQRVRGKFFDQALLGVRVVGGGGVEGAGAAHEILKRLAGGLVEGAVARGKRQRGCVLGGAGAQDGARDVVYRCWCWWWCRFRWWCCCCVLRCSSLWCLRGAGVRFDAGAAELEGDFRPRAAAAELDA